MIKKYNIKDWLYIPAHEPAALMNLHRPVKISGAEVEVIGTVRFVVQGHGVISGIAGFVEELRDHAALGIEKLDHDMRFFWEVEAERFFVFEIQMVDGEIRAA